MYVQREKRVTVKNSMDTLNTNTRNKALPFIAVTILVVSAGIVAFQRLRQSPAPIVVPSGVACTMDAKLCPDGTSVGRIAPTCEFAPCPSSPASPPAEAPNVSPSEPWKSVHDEKQGIDFEYPETLKTRFISPQAWPPTVTVSAGTLDCPTAVNPGQNVERKTVRGQSYCRLTTSEGAAGSVFESYQYQSQRGTNLVTVAFTLRFVQCGNYDETERVACEQERQTFDVDAMADGIAMSVQL